MIYFFTLQNNNKLAFITLHQCIDDLEINNKSASPYYFDKSDFYLILSQLP